MKKIKLILEDKSTYEGYSFGAEKSSSGEIVFTTGMVGYPESLTDPSFRGQILVNTYPLIGNYGVPQEKIDKDNLSNYESNKIQIRGMVVSEYSTNFNHWEAKKSLGDWLKENEIPGITGIDTRALTQKLRTKGSMLGKIIVNNKNVPYYNPNKENLADQVSIKEPITYKRGRKTIVMLDCGTKNNIIREFLNRNITVIQVPWNFDLFNSKLKFHGIFISNGPGDPTMAKQTIETVKQAIKKHIPTFGICLGLQIMALAAGAKTYKLKYGHRGQNQPCIDIINNKRCYISSQNHGFAVRKNTLPTNWIPWMINANDQTIEAIRHKSLPFTAVQFHPEHKPGPTDTEYLFDEFIQSI